MTNITSDEMITYRGGTTLDTVNNATSASTKIEAEPTTMEKNKKNKEQEEHMLFEGKPRYDVCVVGAGISGAVIAEQFASQLGKTSLILERRNHVGGNCYDYVDNRTGILVGMFGRCIFHSNDYRVWSYMQQFSDWSPYHLRVLGQVGDKLFPFPLNIDSVNTLFDLNISSQEEMGRWLASETTTTHEEGFPSLYNSSRPPKNFEEVALSQVGKRLYDLIIKPYMEKKWGDGTLLQELGPEVMMHDTGVLLRNNWDDRYFGNSVFQAVPKYGYTKFFETMLSNPLIELHTGIDYFDVKSDIKCNHTFFTGRIDDYYNNVGLDRLEYRSIDLKWDIIQNKSANYPSSTSVVMYPSHNFTFSRVVQYTQNQNEQVGNMQDTVLIYERDIADGDPIYPVPTAHNKKLYSKYKELATKDDHITFLGTLANYKYLQMDETVINALNVFDNFAPRVAIRQCFHGNTGGPEALVQLLMAFYDWMPTRTFILDHDSGGGHEQKWYEKGYPRLAEVKDRYIKSEELREGDILILIEYDKCPEDLIRKGVKVYIWLLGSFDISAHQAAGCQFFSHNFHLASQYDLNLPRSHIVMPYINIGKTFFGKMQNDKRENLVILNHQDNNGDGFNLLQPLQKFCAVSNNCTIFFPRRLSMQELNKLYLRAKVIFAPCMRGSERGPIESVLAGAVLLTNRCDGGSNILDWPLPEDHILSEKNNIVDVVNQIFNNFEQEQAKLEGFRNQYKSYSHNSMVKDTKRFLHNIV